MIDKIKHVLQNNSKILFFLRYIPYRFRLGRVYAEHQKLILDYEKLSNEDKVIYHYKKLRDILYYVYENNDFYSWFYRRHNYNPSQFTSLDDFKNVPIVTKTDLKQFSLESRSNKKKSSLLVNTGGTSGEPLSFYLDDNAFAREWAYMHNVWSKLGYSYLDTKLTFRGKNNGGIPLKYNVIHNEYIVDAYVSLEKIVSETIKLTDRKKISFLHGYPSSIYEFCKFIETNGISIDKVFKGNLKGVFFGSEYPAPKYREVIERVLKVKTLSWYGHSEMSVLAYEKNRPFVYEPFQTYGYSEALKISETECNLVATSYYNKDSPFIRYDTGDVIGDVDVESGILKSFSITSGRVGDMIFDRNNNPISLTALVFGRHHNAFNFVDFVQVKQTSKGKATLYVTSKKPVSLDFFDLDNVNIDFLIETIDTPYKTKAGKVLLLISDN